MIVIFLGPPGSGKGTQSFFTAKNLNLPHISIGEVLRNEIRAGTPLGEKIRSVVSQGSLVSEDLVNDLVYDKLSQREYSAGCILDGYPRTLLQAQFLYKIVKIHKIIILYFEIHDDIVIERIVGRYSCKDCGAIYHEKFFPTSEFGVCNQCHSRELIQRPDDKLSVVANRLLDYHYQTHELLEFLSNKEYFFKINASGSIDDIKNQVTEVLKMC